MRHPADLDGLVYLGRRCGANCLAMFGDADSPRRYQSALRTDLLGDLATWNQFRPMLDRLGVRLTSMPEMLKEETAWALQH